MPCRRGKVMTKEQMGMGAGERLFMAAQAGAAHWSAYRFGVIASRKRKGSVQLYRIFEVY